MRHRTHLVRICLWVLLATPLLSAAEKKDEKPARPARRVLLIGQGQDNHPWGTHEYRAGMRILASLLQPVDSIQTIIVSADGDWPEGPELLDGADGVVLFVSEGAKWIHQDSARLKAFQNLAARGGGFASYHWGMGCRDAEFVENFVQMFGGCHGGPDRKYKVVDGTHIAFPNPNHPVLRGLEPFDVAHEEFYYTLKFPKDRARHQALFRVTIDDQDHTVAWAWERPQGGRSFGFSGGHFHDNWKLPQYRRVMAQGVLWTLGVNFSGDSLSLKINDADLKSPRPLENEKP